MKKLTALDLALARVAEVGAFEDVSLLAVLSLVAVAVKPEGTTNQSTWGYTRVSIMTVGVRTVALDEVNTCRGALGRQVMGKITRLPVGAVPLVKQLPADGNF